LVFARCSAAPDRYTDQEASPIGLLDEWQKYLAIGSTAVVIADNARNVPDVIECLEGNESKPSACSVNCLSAYPRRGNIVLSAERIPQDTVVIDFAGIFGEDSRREAAVGGVVVYRDSHHLASTFSKSITPVIAQQLDAAVAAMLARYT
jgi:hypothetical protein